MDAQTATLTELRRLNPGKRFAASTDGAAVGIWEEAWGRFRMVLSRAINGSWVWLDYECMINGQPPYSADQWCE